VNRNVSNADVAPIAAFPRKQGEELSISSFVSRSQFSFVRLPSKAGTGAIEMAGLRMRE
jgi:hypothetical protein